MRTLKEFSKAKDWAEGEWINYEMGNPPGKNTLGKKKWQSCRQLERGRGKKLKLRGNKKSVNW